MDRGNGPAHEDQAEPEQPVSAEFNRLLERAPTGIPGLDTILHGGFLRGSIYLIAGPPGSGKTILCNQIAFNHIGAGGNVVYVSVLTETHSRLFGHLNSMSFFSHKPIGTSLLYISGHGVAGNEGLRGLFDLLQRTMRESKASMLIVDGVVNAEAIARSDLAFNEFVHQLQVYAEFTGCIVLLIRSQVEGEAGADEVMAHGTVDGLVQLKRNRLGMRLFRELEVVKFRGSGFLEGGHVMRITQDGVGVFPRTEAVLGAHVGVPDETSASRQRLAFGIEGLDEMLQGGLLLGSSTVLLGPPGSGKTLLGLSFLAEGARRHQPSLYFGLSEPASVVLDAGDQIGLDFRQLATRGQVQVVWQPEFEATLDVLADQLLAAVRTGKIERLFIDGLDAVSYLSMYAERVDPFFRALTAELLNLGVTTLISIRLRELFGPTAAMPLDGAPSAVENIVFVRYVELNSQLHRLISVLETRRSGHDAAIRKFRISGHGIEVAGRFDGAEAILTGVARPLPDMPTGGEET